MNLKKLFATSAVLTLAVSTFAPAINSAKADYNSEINSAYSYAYERNVTTLPTVESANPMGKAIRGHVAKMISNWALVVLNKQPNEAVNPVFTDIAGESEEIQGYIKKSAQQGLMGQGIAAFGPQNLVTRAQFGTVLSRALFGDKYNDGNPYYVKHLENLKKVGIMNDITNVERPVLRYEIWLMLQRAEKLVSKDQNDGLTADQILKCFTADDYLACLNETKGNDTKDKKDDNKKEDKKDEIVRKGDLNVSIVDYSSAVRTAPKGIFVANTLRFAVSEDVTLDTLTLKRSGLSTRNDIEKVWLERNGVAVTNSASVSSDGLSVLNFKNGKNVVTSNAKSQDFDLVIQLKSSATPGNEVTFELYDATASAKNIEVKGETTTYRIAGYSVVNLKVEAINATASTYTLGNQSDFVIGQFALDSNSSSDDRDIFVRSLTFRNTGDLDFDSTFKNVKLYRDSKVVSNGVEINGRDITITLDKDVIKANKRALYTIRAEVANLESVGKNVELEFRNNSSIIADEADTGFRTNLTGITSGLKLAKYTFNGGRIVLETEKNFPRTVEAGKGSNDITIAAGRISTTENVELPKIVINYNNNGWSTTDAQGANTIKRLVLEIGGSRYTADNNGNGSFVFDGVYVRKSSDVRLLVSIDSRAKNGNTITFPATLSNALMMGDGEYQSNSEPLMNGSIAGAINISKVLIKESRFQLLADGTSTQSTLVGDSSVKTVMSGKLSSKDKMVNVNSLKVKTMNPIANGFVDVYLDVNGQPFSNATLNGSDTEFTFNSLGTIDAGSDMKFEIRVQPNVQTVQDITLTVEASGTDSNGNPVATSTEYSAKLEVKSDAAIDVSNIISSNRVVEPTVNSVLYEGTLNISNGATELSSFALSGVTTGDKLVINNYKLYVDGEFVADANNNPVFTALNQNLEEGKRVVVVKANVQTNPGTVATGYSYKIDEVVVNNKAYKKPSTAYFAKGFFKLSKQSTNNEVLIVKLTNTSSNSIDVTKLSLSATGTDNVASASVNGQVVDITNGTVSPQTVPAKGEIMIELIAKKGKLVRLNGVEYTVTDGNDKYTYELTKDDTSIGSWGNFFSNM